MSTVFVMIEYFPVISGIRNLLILLHSQLFVLDALISRTQLAISDRVQLIYFSADVVHDILEARGCPEGVNSFAICGKCGHYNKRLVDFAGIWEC